MRRPQFSLKTMFWLMLVVAALLSGREIGVRQEHGRINELVAEQEELRDEQASLRKTWETLVRHQMEVEERDRNLVRHQIEVEERDSALRRKWLSAEKPKPKSDNLYSRGQLLE